jgi:hypothetical protein
MHRAGIVRTLAPGTKAPEHRRQAAPKPERPTASRRVTPRKSTVPMPTIYAARYQQPTRKHPVNPSDIAAEMRAAIDARIAAGAVTVCPSAWAEGSFVSIYGTGA